MVARPVGAVGSLQPPFLDWIENAPVTTAFASPFEALRGTTPWLNYLSGAAGPSWPAGWLLVTTPALVFATAGLAVAGLVGLRLVPRRHQAFLALSVLVGLALVTFGHTGAAASPIAALAQDQLDGVLAPLRNTHKFEVVVRLLWRSALRLSSPTLPHACGGSGSHIGCCRWAPRRASSSSALRRSLR